MKRHRLPPATPPFATAIRAVLRGLVAVAGLLESLKLGRDALRWALPRLRRLINSNPSLRP